MSKRIQRLQSKSILVWVAALILILILIRSYFLPGKDLLPKMQEILPQAESFTRIDTNPLTFAGIIDRKTGPQEKVGYVVVDEANGYAGPLIMVTGIDLEGRIIGTSLAEYKDTPSFIHIVLSKGFLQQFNGKKITDPLQLDKDIDGISGATLSSRAMAKAIAGGSHAVAKKQFGLDVPGELVPWQFGTKEVTVTVLLMLMLIGVLCRQPKLRWVTLLGSLVFIGAKFNIGISLSNIAGILMGFFPPIRENVYWYLWFLGVPILIFLLGRNFYCFWLCPFGAMQEITAKIGGGTFRCHRKIEKKAKQIKYILAFSALLGAFWLKAPGFASYEPFATLFSLQAYGIQWFILPIVLFASLFITRFWCNYFCPVWVANEVVYKLRKRVDNWRKGKSRWEKRNLVSKKVS